MTADRPFARPAAAAGAAAAAAAELHHTFHGRVLRPGDPDFAEAREIWNAAITKQPALIAQCHDRADVAAAVRAARGSGLEIAVRAGGHNIAGTALTDGGMVVDVSPIKTYSLDAAAGTVTAGAGMTWGELDTATQTVGGATPGGIVSSTGLAGLALGGGFGWLSRRYGWTCDNIESARVVTCDGETAVASAEENPELFWALRGGGGNFGVVTDLTLSMHPVRQVFGGSLVFALTDATGVLGRCDEIMAAAPDSQCLVIGIGPPPAAAAAAGSRVLRVSVCDSGSERSGRELTAALTARHRPLFDLTRVLDYRELQTMLDAGGVRGLGHYAKSLFLDGLGPAAVDVLLGHAERASPRSRIVLHSCGGRPSRPGHPDTAFGHRDARYNLQIDSTWEIGADPEPHIRWARTLYEAMTPFGSGGVYVNFLGADADPAGIRAAYGEGRLRRLSQAKARYDPDNTFHVNQNIRPAARLDPSGAGRG